MFVRWFNIYYEQTYCSLLGKIQCTHKIFAVRNFQAVNSSEQRFKHGRSMQVSYIQKIRTVDLLSALAPVTLILLSCSPNLPCASITRHLHSKNVPTVKEMSVKYHNFSLVSYGYLQLTVSEIRTVSYELIFFFAHDA